MEPGMLVGAAGLVSGLGGAYAVNRKLGPETESMAIASLRSVLDDLRIELDRKDKQCKELALKLELAERQLVRLESQLVRKIMDND